MATSRQAIFPSQRLGLHHTPVMTAPEGASETYLRGAPLVYSGGRVDEAGANPRSIVGIALHNGQNNAAEGAVNAQYCPAIQGVIFEGSIDTSAAEGTGAIALADLGAEYGITESSNLWYIDKNKTTGGTNTVARVVGFRDPVGEVMGRIYFIFLSEVTVYQT